jgi:hypothetical protein
MMQTIRCAHVHNIDVVSVKDLCGVAGRWAPSHWAASRLLCGVRPQIATSCPPVRCTACACADPTMPAPVIALRSAPVGLTTDLLSWSGGADGGAGWI